MDIKVYLLRTPEYSIESVNRVQQILDQVEGPINFISENFEVQKKGRLYDSESILSWEEMFELCNKYRATHKKIKKKDFVVLLTSIPNERNWFSAFDGNNIFVHTSGWDRFVDKGEQYPIAHQIVENILQVLMNVGKINSENPYIHYQTRGCINDMCINKLDVMIKLRVADTCKTCKDRINERIDVTISKQIFKLLNVVRESLLNISTESNPNSNIVGLKVSDEGEVRVPDISNLLLTLKPSRAAIYIFYLKHPEGVSLNELRDDTQLQRELADIYVHITGERHNYDSYVPDLIRKDGYFSPYKSEINNIIKKTLNKDIASHYLIAGNKGEKYKISLPQDLIDIRF